jgi:hypothetical protein
MPTITYNFEPQQTVYVVTTCDSAFGGSPSSANTGLQISNVFFPGAPGVQESPIQADNLLVREGVVQEVRASVRESTSNQDAQITVDVLGGAVVAANAVFQGDGYFPDAYSARVEIVTTGGQITGVNIADPGAGYTDGTGFEINITDSALWTGGSVGRISYDIVDGRLTNGTVIVPGTGYVNGTLSVGTAATQVPYPDEAPAVSLTTTAGGTSGTLAELLLLIRGGVVDEVIVTSIGSGYTDGTSQLVTDVPEADANQFEIVYAIRLTDTRRAIYISVPVNAEGEEQTGDVFETRSEAITAYESRI